MAECILNPASQDVADFIYRFGSLQNNLRDPEQFPCVDYVSNDYAVFYTELENALPLSLERQPYYSIPSLFTLLDDSAMEAAGIVSALQTPALSNMGSGVIIGIVDTGIDYTSPVFRKSDGTTRILGLWDQTLPEDPSVLPPGVPEYYPMGGASYGTEFTHEEINEALTLEDPFSLVPSKDTDGHGTFLAGLAAGTAFPLQNFTGAAPMADLAIVKLKPAKKYLRDYYLISEDTPAFQENDIMMGIKYLRVIADRFRRPLVTLLGLGTNYGSHTGTSPLSQVTQNYGGFFGIATVIAAGNETGLAHHYAGRFSADTSFEDVELRVGEEEGKRGFILELWSSAADLYTVGFVSPGGERISRIPILSNNETRIPFLLESTVITVSYQLIEAGSGSQLVSMRFERPSPGIWTIRVYNTQFLTGEYHMWLPVQGFISDETVFFKTGSFKHDHGSRQFPPAYYNRGLQSQKQQYLHPFQPWLHQQRLCKAGSGCSGSGDPGAIGADLSCFSPWAFIQCSSRYCSCLLPPHRYQRCSRHHCRSSCQSFKLGDRYGKLPYYERGFY